MKRAYAAPLGFALVSTAGLLLALVYDGIADVLALGLLVIPLVILVRQLARLRARTES